MRFPWRRSRRPPARCAPARQWFRVEDGTYLRNCPLIAGEREEVRAWPAGTPLKWAVIGELSDEWWRTFREGVQRKRALGSRDVAAVPGAFREAYPGHPGLRALDGQEAP